VIRTPVRTSCLILSTLLAVPQVSAQTGSRLWRPEERTLLTDFSVVDAVAADENTLYLVSRTGIGVYDRRSRQWQPPVTVLEGYVPQRALSALIDPGDGSLWIATAAGLVHFSPRVRLLEHVMVVGGVSQLTLDRQDPFAGVYFVSRSGWMSVPRGGIMAQRAMTIPHARNQVRALDVAEVLRRHPTIETTRTRVLVDERLRSYRFTAAAEVRLTDDVFLGTNGMGVIRYDAQTTDFEPLPFGLLSEGAVAVEVVLGGVWAAADGRSPRSGFTFVASDLQRFAHEEGRRVTGLATGRVWDLLSRDRRLWAATDAGLIAFDRERNPLHLTTSDGLPSSRVLSLASGSDGVWVGTTRGLAFVRDGGTVERIGEQLYEPILSLAARSDTVWVGTRSGLGLSWAGSERVVVPPGVRAVPDMNGEIVALATSDEIVVAATRDRIVIRTGSGEQGAGSGWLAERSISTELGDLTSVAADGDGVWIGGTRGLAHYGFAGRAFVFFIGTTDVPGPVLDLATDDRYLWVATDRGLVRFDKGALAR
jgi:ligand-binding sensor domain-containing protein